METRIDEQELLDGLPVPLVITGPDGRVLSENTAAQQIDLGRHVTDGCAIQRAELVSPPSNLLREVHRRGREFAQLVQRDGTVVEVFLRRCDVSLGGRQVTAVMAEDAGWYIWEKRRTEREHNLLVGVFDTIDDMLLVLDDKLTVLRASQAYLSAFQVEEADVVGNPLAFIHNGLWDQRALLSKLASVVPAEGEVLDYECSASLPDRGPRDLQISARKIHRAGNGTRTLLMTVRDVTGVQQRQDEVLRRAKLDAMGNLAGGLAHDINNRLQPVMTYAQLAARNPDTPKLAQWMRQIETNARKARNVVRNVLAFARKSPVEGTLISLAAATMREVEEIRDEMPDTICIRTSIDPDVPAVESDTGELEQILDNLTSNARHAMPSGGILTIGVAHVSIDQGVAERESLAPGEYVRLSVEDQGCGISAEHQGRIFDPFFTTKEVGRGTGLGLSIVHGLVTGRGGQVRVRSEQDRGTRFDLYFPVADADGR
ncbi:two-component system sensor histidine kinase NtrB [Rhodovibrio salinarum]|uniref:histidine kinase n=1 Tax=Rhodovibrio salinarum TaxID=1087 RepID=A0A934QEC5_9PROT|nr:ATP-binding protein [Rhodovibrio salinarum]MBK1695738.1 hypothetical protein [Rhodovibrio salinarum]